MKYVLAMAVLLGVSAWGQSPTTTKKVLTVETVPLKWSDASTGVFQAPPLDPKMVWPLKVYGPGIGEIAACGVDGKGGWKDCKIADGHTLDEVITAIITSSMQMASYEAKKMDNVREALAKMDEALKNIDDARAKHSPKKKRPRS